MCTSVRPLSPLVQQHLSNKDPRPDDCSLRLDARLDAQLPSRDTHLVHSVRSRLRLQQQPHNSIMPVARCCVERRRSVLPPPAEPAPSTSVDSTTRYTISNSQSCTTFTQLHPSFHPLTFFAVSMLAFDSNNSRTTASCPLLAAALSGVDPSCTNAKQFPSTSTQHLSSHSCSMIIHSAR